MRQIYHFLCHPDANKKLLASWAESSLLDPRRAGALPWTPLALLWTIWTP